MTDENLKKSMKRAHSGGTHHFLKTKFLGLEGEIYNYELEFSKECLNPFKTVQGGMIASAIDEITSISVNIFTKDEYDILSARETLEKVRFFVHKTRGVLIYDKSNF